MNVKHVGINILNLGMIHIINKDSRKILNKHQSTNHVFQDGTPYIIVLESDV